VPVLRAGDRGEPRETGGRDRDRVVVEEPLEVRFEGRCLLVTMRTPGDDLDLVRGLLYTEDLVRSPSDVAAVAHCADVPADAAGNVAPLAAPGRRPGRGNALRQG
jgi:FdhD protein